MAGTIGVTTALIFAVGLLHIGNTEQQKREYRQIPFNLIRYGKRMYDPSNMMFPSQSRPLGLWFRKRGAAYDFESRGLPPGNAAMFSKFGIYGSNVNPLGKRDRGWVLWY